MKLILLVLILLVPALHADESILLQRIIALENHVTELEARLAPVLEKERIKKVVAEQKSLARERMLIDAEILTRHDLNLIEKAYHTVNEDIHSEPAQRALAFLIEKYPQANRTGCAILTRAQSISGSEQRSLLQHAIEKYSTCYYADGTQVGPYAQLYLAMLHIKEGHPKEANPLFASLRASHPNAIDHKGQLLSSHIDEIK